MAEPDYSALRKRLSAPRLRGPSGPSAQGGIWREILHPRDAFGRFRDKPDFAAGPKGMPAPKGVATPLTSKRWGTALNGYFKGLRILSGDQRVGGWAPAPGEKIGRKGFKLDVWDSNGEYLGRVRIRGKAQESGNGTDWGLGAVVRAGAKPEGGAAGEHAAAQAARRDAAGQLREGAKNLPTEAKRAVEDVAQRQESEARQASEARKPQREAEIAAEDKLRARESAAATVVAAENAPIPGLKQKRVPKEVDEPFAFSASDAEKLHLDGVPWKLPKGYKFVAAKEGVKKPMVYVAKEDGTDLHRIYYKRNPKNGRYDIYMDRRPGHDPIYQNYLGRLKAAGGGSDRQGTSGNSAAAEGGGGKPPSAKPPVAEKLPSEPADSALDPNRQPNPAKRPWEGPQAHPGLFETRGVPLKGDVVAAIRRDNPNLPRELGIEGRSGNRLYLRASGDARFVVHIEERDGKYVLTPATPRKPLDLNGEERKELRRHVLAGASVERIQDEFRIGDARDIHAHIMRDAPAKRTGGGQIGAAEGAARLGVTPERLEAVQQAANDSTIANAAARIRQGIGTPNDFELVGKFLHGDKPIKRFGAAERAKALANVEQWIKNGFSPDAIEASLMARYGLVRRDAVLIRVDGEMAAKGDRAQNEKILLGQAKNIFSGAAKLYPDSNAKANYPYGTHHVVDEMGRSLGDIKVTKPAGRKSGEWDVEKLPSGPRTPDTGVGIAEAERRAQGIPSDKPLSGIPYPVSGAPAAGPSAPLGEAGKPGQVVPAGAWRDNIAGQAKAGRMGQDLKLPNGWEVVGLGRVRAGSGKVAERYNVFVQGPGGEKRMVPAVPVKRGPRGGVVGLNPAAGPQGVGVPAPETAGALPPELDGIPLGRVVTEPKAGQGFEKHPTKNMYRIYGEKGMDPGGDTAFGYLYVVQDRNGNWREVRGDQVPAAAAWGPSAAPEPTPAPAPPADRLKTGEDYTGPAPIPGKKIANGKVPKAARGVLPEADFDRNKPFNNYTIPPGYVLLGSKQNANDYTFYIGRPNGEDVHGLRVKKRQRYNGIAWQVQAPGYRAAAAGEARERQVAQRNRRAQRRLDRGEAGPRTLRQQERVRVAVENEAKKQKIRDAVAVAYPGARNINVPEAGRVAEIVDKDGNKWIAKFDENFKIIEAVAGLRDPTEAPEDHIINPKPFASEPLPDWLTTGKIEAITKRKSDSVNATFFANSPDGRGVLLKPEKGQYSGGLRAQIRSDGLPPDDGLQREMGGQVVARMLGVRMPRTTIRTVDMPEYITREGQEISAGEDTALAVERLTNVATFNEADFARMQKVPTEEFTRLAAMDAIIGNLDRHGGNVMIDKEGRLWAIDHGLAFAAVHARYEGNTIFQDKYAGTMSDSLHLTVKEMLARKDELAQQLKEAGVSDESIAAALQRLAYMARTGKIPTSREIRAGVIR